ncbi:hypothetical protein GCM10020000_44120 [Streptomyces olivoverticillatus]
MLALAVAPGVAPGQHHTGGGGPAHEERGQTDGHPEDDLAAGGALLAGHGGLGLRGERREGAGQGGGRLSRAGQAGLRGAGGAGWPGWTGGAGWASWAGGAAGAG